MQKKSNLWLIVIAIIVLLALLWPVLRREKTPIDTTALDEETATTSEDIILNLNDDGSLTPAGLLSDSNDETTSTSPINQISSQTPTSLPLKISFGNQTRNPKTWQCNTTYAVGSRHFGCRPRRAWRASQGSVARRCFSRFLHLD